MFVVRRILVGVLVLVAACSANPTAAPPPTFTQADPTPVPPPSLTTSDFIEATPATPLNVRGAFVYAAGDGSLWQQDAQTADPVPLVKRSTDAIAQMPAFSPDGTYVAYAALLFLPDGNVRGDIRLIQTDGKNMRPIVRGDANDVVYMYPRFSHDGRLLVTRIDNLQFARERAALEWIDADTGNRTPIINNARDADVSPDGARIAFVRYEVAAMRSALWLADADGSNAQELVNDRTFNAILNPRFSPDGKWLAFAVHGAPQQELPQAFNACGLRVLLFCFARTASAHTAPGALWRMNLETKKFQQLMNVYDDTPTPAWSVDSSTIAIHDFIGIRLVDLPQQKIYPLFLEDGGMGGFDWHDP